MNELNKNDDLKRNDRLFIKAMYTAKKLGFAFTAELSEHAWFIAIQQPEKSRRVWIANYNTDFNQCVVSFDGTGSVDLKEIAELFAKLGLIFMLAEKDGYKTWNVELI